MSKPNRYNILLIVIDALRPDHLGCYGYHRNTSPAIDRIAAEGVLFKNTISQSSWTKPAVASLLTGTCPETHGVKGIRHALPELDTYLPTLLQGVGYATGCIQTNPFLSVESGFSQGFDLYLELFDKAPGVYKPRVSDAVAAVSTWLSRPRNAPFFLYLHLLDTHNPYAPPKEFRLFGNEETDLYDAEIAFVDYHIQLIREMLLKNGLYDKTALIITADHGEEFFEHGTQYHAKNLYQEVIKVPLIISVPGIFDAAVPTSSQVRSLDIVPTILDIAGLPSCATHEGISLVRHMQGETVPDFPAFSQIGDGRHAGGLDLISFSTGEYKLIVDKKANSRELYHLAGDPHERCNRVEQDGNIARQLEAQAIHILCPSEDEKDSPKRKKKATPEIITIDDHVRQQLRGLGYIE
jgi:arylsulfatase